MLVSIILCVTQVGFPSKLVCESLPLRTLPQIMFPIRSNVKEGREGKGKGRGGNGRERTGRDKKKNYYTAQRATLLQSKLWYLTIRTFYFHVIFIPQCRNFLTQFPSPLL